MRTELEQLVDLQDIVIKNVHRMRAKQGYPEQITLHGDEGEILFKLMLLIATGDRDATEMSISNGFLLFEGTPVICR